VMLAGTGLRGDLVLLQQNELLARASGMAEDKIARASQLNSKTYDKIVNTKENVKPQEMTDFLTSIKPELAEFAPDGISIDDYIKISAVQMTSPWMQYFLRYDPASALEKVKCPVFAVNGSNDLQVASKENLSAISAALKKGGNKKLTIKEYLGLNHLFQECATGLPGNYEMIEQTFSPDVLKDLADWISKV